jgi:hypothetical protein
MASEVHGDRISLRLELDRGSEPISGRLIAADGSEVEFQGLLALAAAIERAATEVEEVR